MEGRKLVCLRRVGAMDVARITISADADEIRPYIAAGSPIKITWAGAGRKDAFYGYVHTFNPISIGYLHRTVILAVSAAYPMFNEAQRTFYQAGIHNVAEEIADDHGFQLETDPHSLTMDQILQQDDSDWRFLGRLVDQWGYVLMQDGVTLVFRPLLDVVDERARMAEDERTQLSVSPNGSNFLTFEPSFSAVGDVAVTTTYSQGTRYVATEIPRQETRTGIFEQVITSRSITTDLESEAVAVANEVKQRFPFVAKARVMFPTGKKPLDCYRITHDGARMVWAVQQVKHVVTGDAYVGEMVLGSDGTDADRISRGMDIQAMCRKRSSNSRPRPVIRDFRQYFKGTKGDVLVKDQRWRAPILHSREET
jgi:hypothetical protein